MEYTQDDLAYFISEYINKEIQNGRVIDSTAINNAMEDFEDGSYNNEGVGCHIVLMTEEEFINNQEIV